MSARYRIRESRNHFTPQRRVLWFWVRLARPQTTLAAATEIIRRRLKPETPPRADSP